MDTFFLRQIMLSKLEEFKMYHHLYTEKTNNQIEFIKEYLDEDHKKDFYDFQLARPDLELMSHDMINEINLRTKMLHGFYQHSMDNYDELHRNGSPLSLTHNGVQVRRMRLPHGTIILSIGYNPVDKVLDVEYKNQKVYRYKGVPKAVAKLIGDEHTGEMINKIVKGKYEFDLIS